MKCPYCDNEMVSGYLQSARDIVWGESKHKIFFEAGDHDITLARGLSGAITEASCCPTCKKIIINYIDYYE